MKSTIQRERSEQEKWQLRPEWSSLTWPANFIENEFLPPEQLQEMQSSGLQDIIRFAGKYIPFYQQRFAELGLQADDIRSLDDLACLPVLSREDVQTRHDDLMALVLPAGQGGVRTISTSGSTGSPVYVTHSDLSSQISRAVSQRLLRWMRRNPMGKFAAIRSLIELCNARDPDQCPEAQTYWFDSWPYSGQFFRTGPYVGYAHTNSLAAQMDWLLEQQPDYLNVQSAGLEYLALGFSGSATPGSLKGLHASAQQLTPLMRQSIENTFVLPIAQAYGLNEFGIVAARCPEGGRYHVHIEHCIVEIVDQQGDLCAPGETGRLLVTTLVNAAMPLFRYDTGDLATVSDGPCECGRTLPTFASIQGRYRRIAHLPEGTWSCWAALQTTLANMPAETKIGLHRYQLHQYADQRFELRLETRGELNPEFVAAITQSWQAHGGESPRPLSIIQLTEIPRGGSVKFENFTSDFVPEADL